MKDVRESQGITSYQIGGWEYPRVPLGKGYEDDPCSDCRACFGEFHACGCEFELCPSCGCQAISCDCGDSPSPHRELFDCGWVFPDVTIDRSECHPDAGVWVAVEQWRLRVECAKCRAEVRSFQLTAPYSNGPVYFHCRCNPVSGHSVVTVSPEECTKPGCPCGMTSIGIISCASCGSKLDGPIAFGEYRAESWNPTARAKRRS
jgi:hypothetical protein